MPLSFEEEITSFDRLRALMPLDPDSKSPFKDSDHINATAKKLIALSPFVVIGTIGGQLDVSPKGDPAGFVEIYDDKTLIIPDRLGNNRADGFRNILRDPRIGLLFLIPGHTDTLRVSGRARIVRDQAINARHAFNGREPTLAIVVHVENVFMQCAKAFIRSHFWKADTWPERGLAPPIAEWMIETVEEDRTLEDLSAHHAEVYRTKLY